MTPFEQVGEFHKIFGHPTRTEPTLDVPDAIQRYEYIDEEVIEFSDAVFDNDFTEQVDALGDTVYVVEGACHAFGLGDLSVIKPDDGISLGEMTVRMNGFLPVLEDAIVAKDVLITTICLSAIKGLCYAISEKMGFDLEDIITIIHEANLSKLGEDGKPIYAVPGDSTTKVVKGPNFVKPNEKIEAYLSARS